MAKTRFHLKKQPAGQYKPSGEPASGNVVLLFELFYQPVKRILVDIEQRLGLLTGQGAFFVPLVDRRKILRYGGWGTSKPYSIRLRAGNSLSLLFLPFLLGSLQNVRNSIEFLDRKSVV